MGDRRKQAFHVQFNSKFKLDFHGTKITSDAAWFVLREVFAAILEAIQRLGVPLLLLQRG